MERQSKVWGLREGTANPFIQMFLCLGICVPRALWKSTCARLLVAIFAGKDVAPYSGRFAVQVIKNK